MNEASVKGDWLRIISPAIVAIAFSLFLIIGSLLMLSTSGGWSYLGVIVFGPVCLGLVLLDVLTKFLIKGKAWLIWLVELVAIVLIYIFLDKQTQIIYILSI